MIADLAIMSDMRVTKKKIVITDASWDFSMGAAMNGGIFAKYIVVANLQIRRLAYVFKILSSAANRSKSEKFIVGTDFARSLDDNVRVKHTAIANGNSRPDHAIRSNRDVPAKFGRGRDDGSGMYHREKMRLLRKGCPMRALSRK
jgi:hypothetical protein